MPGLDVSGKVRMDGAPSGIPAGKRNVKLEPLQGYSPGNLQRSGGEVDADGMFRITGVGPARYKVRVDPLPEGAYVKAVELDGASSSADLIDLANASKAATANIVIGRGGVVVSGHVLDAGGERTQTGLVMIFLVKEFEEMVGSGNGNAQAAPDGSYILKPFAPGKY